MGTGGPLCQKTASLGILLCINYLYCLGWYSDCNNSIALKKGTNKLEKNKQTAKQPTKKQTSNLGISSTSFKAKLIVGQAEFKNLAGQ